MKVVRLKICLLSLFFFCINVLALPPGFVYLAAIDPTIQQDIRYAGFHNFVGRPIHGYEKPQCILTIQTALALKKIAHELKKLKLGIKVYDCYRPTRAVQDFVTWSIKPAEQQMKQEFYPRTNKADFFQLGYVALKSGHSRGSTVDLTIIPLNSHSLIYHRQQPLISCFAPYRIRFADNSIDMGTGYDCMDTLAWITAHDIPPHAQQNRIKLQTIMQKYHFLPYEKEWWHFTLKDEPFPETYFNFFVK